MVGSVTLSGSWSRLARGLAPLLVVGVLAQFAGTKDVFGELTRPVVLWVLRLLGIAAENAGDVMHVGHLEIPWTRDCAGTNLLLILLALAVWINRTEKISLRYWMKIGLMLPAAILANILRVLTLIGYRAIAYPAIESPQLHYFFGLFWLVPFAMLVIPRGGRPLPVLALELFHAACVVALLAPAATAPGGVGLTVAVILCLANCRVPEVVSSRRLAMAVLWVFTGCGIGLAAIESLWMPWLLLCPLVVSVAWLRKPYGAVLVLASYPLFVLIPGAEWITWAAALWAVWKEFGESRPQEALPEVPRPAVMAFAGVFLVLPFLASTFLSGDTHKIFPPAELVVAEVPGEGFEIALPDQDENLGLLWYGSQGAGRHHTLKVCMQYRGVTLQDTPGQPSVCHDDEHFFREFFLQGGRLINTYGEYLAATAVPRSSPGVHLIFVAKKESMSPEDFDRMATETARRLVEKMAPQ